MDARPSGCDVVGCDQPATGSYLHSRESLLMEFSICDGHYARLRNGEPPVIADDPGLGAPVLILERINLGS